MLIDSKITLKTYDGVIIENLKHSIEADYCVFVNCVFKGASKIDFYNCILNECTIDGPTVVTFNLCKINDLTVNYDVPVDISAVFSTVLNTNISRWNVTRTHVVGTNAVSLYLAPYIVTIVGDTVTVGCCRFDLRAALNATADTAYALNGAVGRDWFLKYGEAVKSVIRAWQHREE
jgi:hypothetical protein